MNQEKIGKFISKLRKEQNMTQEQLAEKLGVTNKSISRWENGKTMPDLSLFKPLCDILGITINELMSGEKINNIQYNQKLEENIINTIDYIDKKKNYSNDIKNIFLLIIGIIGIILSQFVFSDYELENYLTVVSMILMIYGIKQLFIKYILARKIVAILLIIFCIIILIIK